MFAVDVDLKRVVAAVDYDRRLQTGFRQYGGLLGRGDDVDLVGTVVNFASTGNKTKTAVRTAPTECKKAGDIFRRDASTLPASTSRSRAVSSDNCPSSCTETPSPLSVLSLEFKPPTTLDTVCWIRF